MNKINIYGEPGCQNHGNEAIVRGVCNIFNDRVVRVFSMDAGSGKKFQMDNVCELRKQGVLFVHYQKLYYILKKYRIEKISYFFLFYHLFFCVKGVYLLEAGDQYCENEMVRSFYAFANRMLNLLGAKTILMGCTIDERILTDKAVLKDLKRYKYIIPRESVTLSNLRKAGFKNHVTLIPCPAFLMEAQECPLPSIFSSEVIGINVGFLAQGNEKYYHKLVSNYQRLAEHIIKNTEYNIALIPHVNGVGKYSDIVTLKKIYCKYINTGRVALINDMNAMKLKYVISKCKFMVALRTHACVAALSSMVPTILTGYKTKTKGIVRDIMDDDESILLELQSITSSNELIDKFKWLENNEHEVRIKLERNIPQYRKCCYQIAELVDGIVFD